MDEVEIRPIPGFPDYTISTDGRVFCSIKYGPGGVNKPRMAIPREVVGCHKKSCGGVRVVLRNPDGTKTGRLVDRLVLEAFVGHQPEGWDAFHRDDDKLNNRLANLEWRQKHNLPDIPIRPIPGFPGYGASEDGRIWSYRRCGITGPVENAVELVGSINRWGYRTVVLIRDGRKFPKRVNRLILETFVGPCPEGMESAHWDSDRLNNKLSNLRWATHKDNAADKIRNGTHAIGSRHNHAKLHEDDVTEMRQRHAKGESIRSLADAYGQTYFHMHAIIRRRCWKHIP